LCRTCASTIIPPHKRPSGRLGKISSPTMKSSTPAPRLGYTTNAQRIGFEQFKAAIDCESRIGHRLYLVLRPRGPSTLVPRLGTEDYSTRKSPKGEARKNSDSHDKVIDATHRLWYTSNAQRKIFKLFQAAIECDSLISMISAV